MKIIKHDSRTESRASCSNGETFAALAGGTANAKHAQPQVVLRYPRSKSRGQASSIDLMIGFFIFLIIFALVMGTVNKNFNDVAKNSEIDEIKHDSFFALKELTETKGFPENWEGLNENDAERIGLIERNNEISEDKLVAFSNMTYSKTKELLGLEGYDYFFVLTQGTTTISAGLSPASQVKYLIQSKRIVNYKGSEAEIEFKVYSLWE